MLIIIISVCSCERNLFATTNTNTNENHSWLGRSPCGRPPSPEGLLGFASLTSVANQKGKKEKEAPSGEGRETPIGGVGKGEGKAGQCNGGRSAGLLALPLKIKEYSSESAKRALELLTFYQISCNMIYVQ